MSQQYDNTDSGALFRNERKTKENQPGYKGQAEIKCPHCGESTEFWVSAWVKKARESGNKFFSMAFQAKEEQQKTENHNSKQGGFDDFDDDIPF